MSDSELEQLRVQLKQARSQAAAAANTHMQRALHDLRLAAFDLVRHIEWVEMTDDWNPEKCAEAVRLTKLLRAELQKGLAGG